MMSNTAHIFKELTGHYHVCDARVHMLDPRAPDYRTKEAALRAAYEAGYTYAVGSGTYGEGVQKLPEAGYSGGMAE